MTGDIIDDAAPIIGTRLLLAGIRDVAPMYYVSGNHEYRSCAMRKIRRELQSFDVIILPDTYARISVKGNDIIIAGVDDPYKRFFAAPAYNQEESMKNAFRELDTVAAYKILLAHRPERIKRYGEYSFNLVVSGHAHGGQVRVPFILNGLFAPHQGWFPKYAGGLYRHASLTHIVSRGLSIYPNLPRIFNPPELVFIKIEAAALI
jgi:predicted MPP superfamily phosphohydrolase